MKFSIITTVYNAKDDIRRTIESVLSQQGVEIEYIITDGGSTDGTLDIIAEYPDVTVYSEPDKGIYDGMNKGVRKATGEIVGILNAADTYKPDALLRVKEAVEANPTAEVFHGKMYWVMDGEVTSEAGKKIPAGLALYRMPVCHPTTFLRKETYDKRGLFDDTYKIAADHKMMRGLIRDGVEFCFIEEVIAEMEGGGASGQHRKTKRDEVLRTLKDHDSPKSDVFHTWYKYGLLTLRDRVKDTNLPLDGLKPLFRKFKGLIK